MDEKQMDLARELNKFGLVGEFLDDGRVIIHKNVPPVKVAQNDKVTVTWKIGVV